MSTYQTSAGTSGYQNVTLGGGAIPAISIADLGMSSDKKFPNHKLTINLYSAHGGYIVEIKKQVPYGVSNEPELYIVHEDQDFDRELGKIITHFNLKAQ